MIYLIIIMPIIYAFAMVWAFKQDKKEKERLKNLQKGLDKSKKICYNKYVR